MDKVSYSSKRKKRRTRRCLNDIRNRLQRKCDNSSDTKSCFLQLQSKSLENNLLTMDRITLKAMFRNAIRSETATRPLLEEIKQKHNVQFRNIVENKSVKTAAFQELSDNTLNTSIFHNSISIAECGKNSLSIRRMCKENNYKHKDEVKSPSSLLLFSPVADSLYIAATVSKSENKQDAVATSTPVLQTSQVYRHCRYKELMNEIPSYIKQLTSFINKEDARRTINNLQKLYMENYCQKQCEENDMITNGGHILTSKTFHIENQLMENPMDYIRSKLERQHKPLEGSSLESLSDNPNLMDDDGAGRSPAPRASSPDLHVGFVPYDTPDYNYYPHRLK